MDFFMDFDLFGVGGLDTTIIDFVQAN